MIPLFKVRHPKGLGNVIDKVYESGIITEGDYADEFEKKIGEYIGNPNICLVNSCTSAISLAAHMCDIGPDHEVITTSMTCLNQDASIKLADGSSMIIRKIVNNKLPVDVMSFNTDTMAFESKRVTNWIKLKNTTGIWYRFVLKNATPCSNGSKRGMWVTGDHKILTNVGYKRVDELSDTDLVVTDRYTLNSKQMEFLDGALLGDGSITSKNTTGLSRFVVGHSIVQSEWIKLKENALKGIGYSTAQYPERDGHAASMYIYTHSTVGFKKERERWYSVSRTKIVPNDLKITPLVLATWFMDDGSLNSPTGVVFCTDGFNVECIWTLFYKLVDFGFKPRVIGLHTKKRRISLGSTDTAKLFNIIGAYVPPTMRYKLGNFDCPEYDQSMWDLGEAVVEYDNPIVTKFEKRGKGFNYDYCIEVEDNHNFIVCSTVVSNCLATNLPFYQLGAKLVFADVDPTTGNLDPKSVAKLVTDKTKAIVVVHWAGQPVELNEIHKIATQYNIPVIEDAAHALRAEYDNIRIGSHSDYVCFSFQAIKQLSTVDGGAIACKRPEDAALIRKIRWFGLDRSFKSPPGQPPASRWEQDITHGGFKMHMNNVNAAIGLLQMETIDEVIVAHIANGKYYDGYIHNPKIEKLRRPTNTKSAFWIYSLLVDDPVKFKQYMTENGIATDVVHVRNDKYTIFENFRPSTPLKGLDHFTSKLMHIPVGWWLSEDERNYIVDTVNKY